MKRLITTIIGLVLVAFGAATLCAFALAERRSREIRTEPPAENIRDGLGPNDIQTINDHRRATLQAPLMIPATEQKPARSDPLRSSFDAWWESDGHRIGGDRIKMSQAFAAGVRAEFWRRK